MTLSSRQLEQESERTRIRLAATLEELRTRLTPGQVVDQLVDYAREGGAGEFMRNLGHEVRGNPLPITLIGAGIAWLMMANGRSSGSTWDGATRAREAADDAASVYQSAAARAADAARSLGDSAARAGESARSISRGFAQFCAEEPLVVAGLGLAVGAALGAALPPSETENRLLGTASDALKDRMQEPASELSQKARNVAEAASQATKEVAESERLTDPGIWNPVGDSPSPAGPASS